MPTAPATHHAKNTANTTFSCGMLQNAGFGTIPCGGGGGVVANREPGTYIDRCFSEGKRLCGVTKLYQNLPKSYVATYVCQGVQGQVAVNV